MIVLPVCQSICVIKYISDIIVLVMVSQTGSEEWKMERLTTDQNGDNQDEVDRVRREHPGEPDCVVDYRVLGAIAPFRCECHSA